MTREERLEAAAHLLERAAENLRTAASHSDRAAEHFREGEVPRAAAHAWAAHGHLVEAGEELDAQAREHARRSSV